MRRLVIVAGLMLVLAAAAIPVGAAIEPGSMQFIESLGNQALQVVRSTMPPAQKLAFFHEVLRQDFDMPRIAQFVLGPYWRRASPAEREQFTGLLADHLVAFYRRQFTRYEGETFAVTGVRPVPGGALVTSRILRPGGAPITVGWRLGEQNGLDKITDVIVDGVSMALSERSALAQQLQANGGRVAGLIAEMRQRQAADLGPGLR